MVNAFQLVDQKGDRIVLEVPRGEMSHAYSNEWGTEKVAESCLFCVVPCVVARSVELNGHAGKIVAYQDRVEMGSERVAVQIIRDAALVDFDYVSNPYLPEGLHPK